MNSDVPLVLSSELKSFVQAYPSWGSELGAGFGNIFGAAPASWPLTVLAMVVAGFVAEWVSCRKLTAIGKRMRGDDSGNLRVVLGYAAFQFVFAFGGIAVSGLAAWLVLSLSIDSELPVYATLKGLLVAVVVLRCCIAGAKVIFSPQSEGIRPVRLSTPDARAFYRWAVGFSCAYVLFSYVHELLILGGMTPVLERMTTSIIGIPVAVLVIGFVWSNRALIEMLFRGTQAKPEGSSILAETLAESWPYLATAWLVLLWIAWAYAVITADAGRLDSVRISWWITLLFPLGDCLVHAGLRKFVELPFLQSTSFAQRSARFVRVVQAGVRVVALIVAVVALAVTWKFAGTDRFFTLWGERLVDVAISIGGTLLVAYVLYEVVMSYLEKGMATEASDASDIEGETGGVGATREETLAPLLKSVFVFLLAVVVVLAVLQALGVQVLPLLAGAGILGLAIGFGSQKLVQDIISGIFFLVDDAFRKGEYVEVGDVKGVVEKISVRSFQLRHQNGPLHSIPFGEIRHLTNYSRDWAVEKLKIRVSYDTDVDRVRKLIKQLGQELLADEELGPLFLQPLKSQGVYSMEDDSAIIIRLKFMTKPGDQFIVRRTIYARLQELFEREGIHVPHRVVTVKLDEQTGEMDEESKRKVAGAAFAAAPQGE